METVAPKIVNRAATMVQPAASPRFVQRKAVEARAPVQVQTSLRVSSPKDPAEREAEATAKKIMRMAIPEGSVAYVRGDGHGVFRQVKPEEKEKKLQRSFESPYITRFAASGVFTQKAEKEEKRILRKAEGQPNVASNVAADIQNSLATGSPLPLTVRRFMEPRFRADFSKVKVHTGDKAGRLNKQLSAQAFAVGNEIFFGKDKFKPDTQEGKELIAHELTHTIQQGAAVQRSEDATVTQQSPIQVQRLGVGDALDFFAREANIIPGFRMFTIILGVNPINMSPVSRSAANILRALVELLPMGGLITQALDNSGIFDKVGAWVEQQFKSLGMVGSSFKQAITDFLNTLSWKDIFDLGGVWTRAKRIFTDPIGRLISFGGGLVAGIVQLVKDAILKPIAKLAEGTEGYALLKAVIGEDPITGDPVPQTAEALIGPFMKLIGQNEIWENMQKARAIPRAFAWFKGALSGLMGFVRQIPGLFIAAFKALELADIILVPLAFAKLAKVFGGFLGKFFDWAGSKIWNLLEIIFDVVSPGAFGYVKKTGAALKSILENPLPFVGNLVKAAKLGFTNFAGNFLTHLKTGLIEWLTGSLPGVYIPKALSLPEIGKFALSVLGITWAQIRGKIVRVLGPNGEKIMSALETAFDIVVALVKGGPSAAWELIKDKLTSLKDQVISGITSMVIETVVSKAVPKLLAMFVPGAGFISAIISIYDTIMVFVQKISKIIQVVTGFINSIVAIASGAIGAAAAKVESTLAGLMSLAISFLAGFVGLGKVADKVMDVIKKVQVAVDKAIDAAIAWIVAKAKALFAKLFGKKDKKEDNEASKAVKAAVRAALAGKDVGNAQQAESIVSTIYQTFSPQGLKGVRLSFNASKPSVVSVMVNASVTDEVASLPITATGAREALEYVYRFRFDRGGTVLYVYYDADSKSYAEVITNQPDEPGQPHAEDVFAGSHLPGLAQKIYAGQAAGTLSTPPGQRVKVELNLNRLPCPRCSSLIARLAGQYPKLQFVVKASSVSPAGTLQKAVQSDSEVHIGFIQKMIEADVKVEPLRIFEAIWAKVLDVAQAAQAGKVKLRTGGLAEEVASARALKDANVAETNKVEALIEDAKRKVALAKVPPKGSV